LDEAPDVAFWQILLRKSAISAVRLGRVVQRRALIIRSLGSGIDLPVD
jgi:hypothetical protein